MRNCWRSAQTGVLDLAHITRTQVPRLSLIWLVFTGEGILFLFRFTIPFWLFNKMILQFPLCVCVCVCVCVYAFACVFVTERRKYFKLGKQMCALLTGNAFCTTYSTCSVSVCVCPVLHVWHHQNGSFEPRGRGRRQPEAIKPTAQALPLFSTPSITALDWPWATFKWNSSSPQPFGACYLSNPGSLVTTSFRVEESRLLMMAYLPRDS